MTGEGSKALEPSITTICSSYSVFTKGEETHPVPDACSETFVFLQRLKSPIVVSIEPMLRSD